MLYNQAIRVIEHGAQMHECAFNIIPKGSAIAAKGDEELIERVKQAASQLGETEVLDEPSTNDGGCEDFTRMMKAVQDKGGKAVHFYVGADFRQEESWEAKHRDMNTSLHSSRFDINEKGLVFGIKALSWILLNL
jgi:aminobenzoyl-glutamate utilization protein A